MIKTINKEIVNTNQYKIDVNTASDKDFDNLPGIGPKLAQEIVSHRNRNGSFESIEAINDIKGIGKSKFMQIKDYLSIKHL
ncbi:MAG: helix-hairpin-helix domain-containing protein [Candidatus Caenarcaniphilales bacterium]|nr:helix-hairpin-helix domain-containing protein [Candidatus Caenarcaniphilales bacterium]